MNDGGKMKSVALVLLRIYKRRISPAFPPSCRYVPTCSEYAAEAIERFGVVRGGVMAVWRLLRCHPLATGGLDPVLKDLKTTRSHQSFVCGASDARPIGIDINIDRNIDIDKEMSY